MGIDISRFKVVHGEKVLRAIALMDIRMPDGMDWENRKTIESPKLLEILALNEDGNIITIRDEAWSFQFIPVLNH